MIIEDRKAELVGAVEYLLECWRDWQASADSRLREDHDFVDAVETVQAVFAEGDIPGECRRLADHVAALDAPWQKWRALCDENPLGAPAQPGEAFWRGVELLETCLSQTLEPRVIRHASVAELIDQKVSPAQICRIWKLLKPDGTPDMQKFYEEKEKPGTHTAVNPYEARAAAEREALRRKVEVARQRLRERRAEKQAPPPDSLEALVGQGVSAKQLAKMFHKPVEWIQEECRRLGLPQPALDYDPATAARAPQEPGWNDEAGRMLEAAGAGVQDGDLSEFYGPQESAAASSGPTAPEGPKKRGRGSK